MRKLLVAISMLFLAMSTAKADISIGLDIQVQPNLAPVPGYPVYYAPGMHANYFFYDGMYWVYQNDTWYSSTWYNGPWGIVAPIAVPSPILIVPVRYYGFAPVYFHAWPIYGAPHWDHYWGASWAHSRPGWDHWDHRGAIVRSPIPTYQRQYTGNRYPNVAQQQALLHQNYHYQPVTPIAREQFNHGAAQPMRASYSPNTSHNNAQAAPRPPVHNASSPTPAGHSAMPGSGNPTPHYAARSAVPPANNHAQQAPRSDNRSPHAQYTPAPSHNSGYHGGGSYHSSGGYHSGGGTSSSGSSGHSSGHHR